MPLSRTKTSLNSIPKKYLIFLPPLFALIVSWQLLYARFSTIDDPLIFASFKNFSFVKIFFVSEDIHWYRPVVDSLLYIEYLLWGIDPFGYHLTSILLHILNTVLTYSLSCIIFNTHKEKYSIAFLSSALFAVHPIHIETIAWISAMADLLSSFFFISALILLCLIKKTKSIAVKLLYGFLSVFLYLLGLFSKETVIIFIPCLVSYFFLSLKLEGESKLKNKNVVKLSDIIIPFTFVMVATISFLIFKSNYLKGSDAGSAINSLYLRHTILPYFEDSDFGTAFFHSLLPFLNFLAAWGFYVKKFFFPAPTNLAIFDIPEDFYTFFGFFIFIIPGYLIFKYRGNTSFLLFSGFISITPAFPIAYSSLAWTHFSERYLYLPSFFFCIAFGFCLIKLQCKLKHKKTSAMLLTFFIILFAFSFTEKTSIWKNSISICKHVINRNPLNPIGYQALGVYYFSVSEYKQAKKFLEQSIKLGGRGPSYFFMGKLAIINGEREKAVEFIKKSIGLQTEKWNYHSELGDIYMAKHQEKPGAKDNINNAIAYYKKSIKLNPNVPSVKYRLTKAYYASGNYAMASASAKDILTKHGDTIWGINSRQFIERAY